jgi:hypothetical protein
MNARLSCNSCAHSWVIDDEPRAFVQLACPQCQSAASPSAAEDFASAIEDALVQLYALSQTHGIELTLSSAAIAASFRPLPQDIDPT